MNPHIEDTQSSIVASNDGVFGLTDRQIMAAQAQAQATLALAYEQRTANLIALHAQTGLAIDYDTLRDRIIGRMNDA